MSLKNLAKLIFLYVSENINFFSPEPKAKFPPCILKQKDVHGG